MARRGLVRRGLIFMQIHNDALLLGLLFAAAAAGGFAGIWLGLQVCL
jgi:hypothetical protein